MGEYRIITHGNCCDGFVSAYLAKRFFNEITGETYTQKQISNIEVIGLQPQDIQGKKFEFTEKDIVLDLPKPEKCFIWVDHHLTAKPENDESKCHWKLAPSNAGLMIEEFSLPTEKSLKESIDIMDSASYSPETLKECYYDKKFTNPSPLLKLHMLGSMFHTKDRTLNEIIFQKMLKEPYYDSPLSDPKIDQLSPEMFHQAQIENFQLWRDNVDTYIKLEKNVVIQDDRLSLRRRGCPDRFYSYMKFPQAKYHVVLKVNDDFARFGLGSNIFKECEKNIGEICKEISVKFGEGSGGGHYAVGGATINPENVDECLRYVIEKLNS